jgi:hypothetical protein
MHYDLASIFLSCLHIHIGSLGKCQSFAKDYRRFDNVMKTPNFIRKTYMMCQIEGNRKMGREIQLSITSYLLARNVNEFCPICSCPCFSAPLVWPPTVSPLALQLPTVLACIQTERPASFAFAFLRSTLATVPSAFLRWLQDRDFRIVVTVTKRSFERILLGCATLRRRLRLRVGRRLSSWLLVLLNRIMGVRLKRISQVRATWWISKWLRCGMRRHGRGHRGGTSRHTGARLCVVRFRVGIGLHNCAMSFPGIVVSIRSIQGTLMEIG